MVDRFTANLTNNLWNYERHIDICETQISVWCCQLKLKFNITYVLYGTQGEGGFSYCHDSTFWKDLQNVTYLIHSFGTNTITISLQLLYYNHISSAYILFRIIKALHNFLYTILLCNHCILTNNLHIHRHTNMWSLCHKDGLQLLLIPNPLYQCL